MQLIIKQTPRFIIAEKPYGMTTHKVDDYKDGFKEFLEQKTGLDLAIVSRLDATTSGLILFPLKAFAGEINTSWQTDQTIKTYLFVTDRKAKTSETSIDVKSFIDQKGTEKVWYSNKTKPANAFSQFTFVSTISTDSGPLYLWQAQIKTGKTHQIRLHALDLGIPILGDTKYSGTPYFRLCLHCSELKIEGEVFTSKNPFAEMSNTYFPLIAEFEKRSRIYNVENQECFRWTHTEVSNGLLDQYGENLFFYVYFGNSDTAAMKQKTDVPKLKIETIEKAKSVTEWISSYFKKPVFLKPMYDRGKAPQKNELLRFQYADRKWSDDFAPMEWTAQENGLKFKLKSHQGQSPGLFLDQRENRKWVLHNSENKSVLNLFSYTSGFSVCAAVGKAKDVTTVDLSKSFIDWSKENFTLNELPPSPQFQFWSADTMHFMKGAINKNRKWDLIICDPPTFGRSDKGVFQIEKDVDLLLQNCFQCLNPGGQILFSTNFEKWNTEGLFQHVRKALPERSFKFVLEKTPYQSLDFDFPNQNQKMKSIFIKKIV
ncbi:MAG: hypothetical protein B7Y39_00840 [Bdellovibrio sp. 28-41-41]|nr:MAG: hypothetical protein B7Y39_00840 [Bdellovibrio sp. 28-41-41]